MSKIIGGKDGPVLGLYSSKDMFEKLKFESLRLQSDWQNPYDSFNFLVTAWHLFHDWPKSDKPLEPSRIKRQVTQLPPEMKFLLNIVQDLANGSKHFSLDPKAEKKRQVDEVHTGNEVGWYQYFFRQRLPGVTAREHFYFNIRVLHNLVMCYFEWVFDDSKLAADFPNVLTEAILHCNIAKRAGNNTSPAAKEIIYRLS